MTTTGTLNRIASALGEPTAATYRPTDRAALIRAAEVQIDKNWGTDMHEAISMWFAARLAELETA